MEDWQKSKAKADRFNREISRCLGEVFFVESPVIEDRKHNTDILIMTVGRDRISCNVRDAKDIHQWGGQFTVRAKRESGAKTELAKVLDGWGDYKFFAWGNYRTFKLVYWNLLDLNVFREVYLTPRRIWVDGFLEDSIQGRVLQTGLIPNLDKKTWFRAFTITDFPKSLVYATGGAIPTR